jgi:hypothetical protein
MRCCFVPSSSPGTSGLGSTTGHDGAAACFACELPGLAGAGEYCRTPRGLGGVGRDPDGPERGGTAAGVPRLTAVLRGARHQPCHGPVVRGERGAARQRSTLVIGDGLWTRRFGRDPALLGAEIELDGHRYTVTGIAPPGSSSRPDRSSGHPSRSRRSARQSAAAGRSRCSAGWRPTNRSPTRRPSCRSSAAAWSSSIPTRTGSEAFRSARCRRHSVKTAVAPSSAFCRRPRDWFCSSPARTWPGCCWHASPTGSASWRYAARSVRAGRASSVSSSRRRCSSGSSHPCWPCSSPAQAWMCSGRACPPRSLCTSRGGTTSASITVSCWPSRPWRSGSGCSSG